MNNSPNFLPTQTVTDAPDKLAFPANTRTESEGEIFPGSIPVEKLDVTHPAFDAEKYAEYRALYKGSTAFRALIDKFLVKRAIEKDPNAPVAGATHYAERKERAYYINRGAGLLDWMASEATKDPARICVDGASALDEAKPTEAGETDKTDAPTGTRKRYYYDLTLNADGLGRDATSIATSLVRECFFFGRAFLYAFFASDVSDPKVDGSNNAWMRVIPTDTVEDWKFAENGQLEWVRIHNQELVRGNPWEPPEYEKHTWVFVTDAHIAKYTATRKRGESWDKETVANLDGEPAKHAFGRNPVFIVEVEDGITVMDRIAEILKALLNREASITWALDQSAYAMLVFMLNQTQISHVYSSEKAACVLKEGENVKFEQPNPQIFDPLFKDADRLRHALYEVIQAAAITAVAQTQNARQSASAKTLDMDLMQTLLRAYITPVRNAMRAWLMAVKTYRGDEAVDAELEGLTAINTTLQQLQQVIDGTKGTSPQQKAANASDQNKDSKREGEPSKNSGKE